MNKRGHNSTRSSAYYTEKLWKDVRRHKGDAFRHADLLLDAKAKLSPHGWEELLRDGPYHDEAAKKFLAFGKDKRLRKAALYELLPDGYSIIYLIHRLTDQELAAAIADNQISPRMSRRPFESWLTEWHAKSNHNSTARRKRSLRILGAVPLADILADSALSEADALLAAREIRSVAKKFGLTAMFSDNIRHQFTAAREEAIAELERKLEEHVARSDHEIDPTERHLLDDALWQHQSLEANRPAYRPDHSHSIQHQAHPYAVHGGWNSKSLLKEMRRRGVAAARASLTDTDAEAECLRLAINCLRGSHPDERRQHREALQAIVDAKKRGWKLAESCLTKIRYCEEDGL